MTEHKLDEKATISCAAQLADAVARIEANHGWSVEDTAGVALATFTEIIARRLGPAQTVRFFQDHAARLGGRT